MGFIGGDEVGALVLDVGAHSFRAGYGGEDTVKVLESSQIGVTDENEFRVPLNFYQHRDDLDVRSVASFDGKQVVYDPKALAAVMHYACHKALPYVDVSNSPLIMTEPNRVTPGVRKLMYETAFEDVGVPSFFALKKAVAACFSVGRSSGVVLDVGASHVSVTPVFETFSLQRGVQEHAFAGDSLDMVVASLLEQRGLHVGPKFGLGDGRVRPSYVNAAIQRTIIQPLKHDNMKTNESPIPASAFTAWQYQGPMAMETAGPQVHELPDGTKLDVSGIASLVPELLFEPLHLAASPLARVEVSGNFQGVASTLADAVCAVDIDARKTVASEIVVCGGSTAFAKFPERLQRSLDSTIFPKVKITAMPAAIDRISASWLGCSIASSLATFQHQWISKSQYYEHGADRLVDKLVLY